MEITEFPLAVRRGVAQDVAPPLDESSTSDLMSSDLVTLGGGAQDSSYGSTSGTISDTAASTTMETEDPAPILVGYAFGPKKLRSMGIVLAEASKTRSTVVSAASMPVLNANGGENGACTTRRDTSSTLLTTEALEARAQYKSCRQRQESEEEEDMDDDDGMSCGEEPSSYPSQSRLQNEEHGSIRISISGGPAAEGINNVVRHFRSSCSSAASVAESSVTTATTLPLSSTASSSGCNKPRPHRPIRVSFVPLDLDSPLEEQHGGNFDAILHKLTEDILTLSKLSSAEEGPRTHCRKSGLEAAESSTPQQLQAVRRVDRLNRYQREHPECCLVDRPDNVQIVMSRSDISRVLVKTLVGVSSTSGIPVRTPRFEVVDYRHCCATCGSSSSSSPEEERAQRIAALVDEAPFTWPLIAKPLTAAGTAESHRMVIILSRTGLKRIENPCLLQEFANHGGTLYKVYVLGDIVRVYRRSSLPDLPMGERVVVVVGGDHPGYVEFDSQRPYPTLADFGVTPLSDETGNSCSIPDNKNKRRRSNDVYLDDTTTTPSASPSSSDNKPSVTADEVRPVVDALRKAFGLQLFGFDVILTSGGGEHQQEMMVVDVNYFPSYKEVSNFPSLLAQYLTQRAIQGRMKHRQNSNAKR